MYNPRNITEYSVEELKPELEKKRNGLEHQQIQDLLFHHILRENLDHIYELDNWTQELAIDWNMTIGSLTLLGYCCVTDLKFSLAALLRINSVRVNHFGIGIYGPEHITPAIAALKDDKKSIFAVLIRSLSTDVNTYLMTGKNLLYHVLQHPNPAFFHLLRQRPDLDVNCYILNTTALNILVDTGNEARLEQYLKHPLVNVNKHDHCVSPLYRAISMGNPLLVMVLLKYGANPEEIMKDRWEQGKMIDLYHANIMNCSNIQKESDAADRLYIGNLLLDMGTRPTPDKQALKSMLDWEDMEQMAHPPDPRTHDLKVLRQQTGRTLFENLFKAEIRSMKHLARGHVLRIMRRRSKGRSMLYDINNLLNNVVLPTPCHNFLLLRENERDRANTEATAMQLPTPDQEIMQED